MTVTCTSQKASLPLLRRARGGNRPESEMAAMTTAPLRDKCYVHRPAGVAPNCLPILGPLFCSMLAECGESCGCFTAAIVQDRTGRVCGCVRGGEHWWSSGWDTCLQHYSGCEIAGVFSITPPPSATSCKITISGFVHPSFIQARVGKTLALYKLGLTKPLIEV